jgi:hypothetical protein
MRGWISSAALFVLLVTVPVWAQRGGGGHGGMGGGHMGGGHVGGGFSGGARGGGGYAYHAGGSYAGYRGGGYRGWGGTAWGGNNWNGRGWYGRGWYGRGWYGNRWGWGYPYWGWGASWYPGWNWGFYGDAGYDSSYSYSPDMSTYTAAPTYAPSYPSVVYMTPDGTLQDSPDSQTQQQISQLQGQVAQLQAQQNASSPRVTDVHYDTVLVYRDGHSETVGNYAIVGNTLWVFNETRARKIPLSELDLRATKRDNQERGNDFVVPGSR